MKLHRSRLFDYPLPDIKNTQYQKLGIFPEASIDEIRAAETRYANQLTRAKAEIEKQIAGIQAQVEGLQKTSLAVDEMRKTGSSTGAYNDLEKKLAQMEEAAMAIDPGYLQWVKSAKELTIEINELNVLSLTNAEKRLAYDQKTPPCALLKMEHEDPEIFTEQGRRLALHLLRSELSDLLESQGEACFHASDLTRKDFHTDFIYNPLLDNPPTPTAPKKKTHE